MYNQSMHELIPLALFAAVGAAAFWFRPPGADRAVARRHMLHGGLLVFGADFVVEFAGTRTGGWTYNKSLWFVTGTIPVELLVLFFSCGVWMAAAHLFILSRNRLPDLNTTLIGVTLASFVLYAGLIAGGESVRMILFTLPFGLWGFSRLDSDRTRAGAVVLATATAVVDWLVETWAVGAGNYGYAEGFTIETPLTYAMLVLGFLGILEAVRSRSTPPTD